MTDATRITVLADVLYAELNDVHPCDYEDHAAAILAALPPDFFETLVVKFSTDLTPEKFEAARRVLRTRLTLADDD